MSYQVNALSGSTPLDTAQLLGGAVFFGILIIICFLKGDFIRIVLSFDIKPLIIIAVAFLITIGEVKGVKNIVVYLARGESSQTVSTEAAESSDGWQLNGDKLIIHAWPAVETVDIRSVSIALVPYDSSWKPAKRLVGTGLLDKTTGYCELVNGQNALVLRHLNPTKCLVLKTADTHYYVLAHPGVEELYRELARRSCSIIQI